MEEGFVVWVQTISQKLQAGTLHRIVSHTPRVESMRLTPGPWLKQEWRQEQMEEGREPAQEWRNGISRVAAGFEQARSMRRGGAGWHWEKEYGCRKAQKNPAC